MSEFGQDSKTVERPFCRTTRRRIVGRGLAQTNVYASILDSLEMAGFHGAEIYCNCKRECNRFVHHADRLRTHLHH